MEELTYETAETTNRAQTTDNEKNWSNNLPKEHNYTNIKKHKNCNLLYITFGQTEGSYSLWLRASVDWDCVVGFKQASGQRRFTHRSPQSFWIPFNVKLIFGWILVREANAFSLSIIISFDWFASFRRFEVWFLYSIRFLKTSFVEFLENLDNNFSQRQAISDLRNVKHKRYTKS